ncbi:MAG: DegV family protein, partial [Firmicutes bacterium]|nr:DegV family protein [Bacillota bacterium]
MKEKICIVTDSCADIPDSFLEQYDIRMIPIIIQAPDHTYHDRVDITVQDVYKLLDQEVVLKSASPTGQDMLDTLEKIKADGYTHAICVMLSSGLSGTYNSLRLWKDSVDGLEVEVFDSLNGSIGCGMMCITLARYRDQGLSFEQLCAKVPGLVKNTYVFFSIEHLDLLERGGRIGKASSLLGT